MHRPNHSCTEGRLLCVPGNLHETVSACEQEGGEEHALLARNTTLATMTAHMHALSPAERQNALCARGAHDLTPLAKACDDGEIRSSIAAKELCANNYTQVHILRGKPLALGIAAVDAA